MISPPSNHTHFRTRFAPSPTGYLHLGHLYAAKVARDLALELGGQYLLRFEDIDTTRVRDHFYPAILEDLAWLKIEHDAIPIKQTNRTVEYEAALAQLRKLGVVYPCFCSRKDIQRELSEITNAPHDSASASQLYPQTCRHLTQQEIADKANLGVTPSWRINSEIARELTGKLTFEDLVHGEITVNHDLLGDTILARKDIGTSYHIAVVVDDAHQDITHVSRGEDLLEATHLHRILQVLLDLPCPQYLHHRLIKNNEGERLAKRAFSETIRDLRSQGFSKTDILGMIDV